MVEYTLWIILFGITLCIIVVPGFGFIKDIQKGVDFDIYKKIVLKHLHGSISVDGGILKKNNCILYIWNAVDQDNTDFHILVQQYDKDGNLCRSDDVLVDKTVKAMSMKSFTVKGLVVPETTMLTFVLHRKGELNP